MIYSAYSSLDFRLAPVLAYGMHLIYPAVLDGAVFSGKFLCGRWR